MREIPRLPRVLLRLLLPAEVRESALEDIAQSYRRDVNALGEYRARLRVWREVTCTNWVAVRLEGGDRLWSGIAEDLWHDLRHGTRLLSKSSLFTAGLLITLGVGIGANTAVYSVVRGVLLQPLAYADEGRLVMVFSQGSDGGRGPASGPDFADWREHSKSFETLAAYASGPVSFAGDGGAERLVGAQVSEDMFRTFGVRAAIGRALIPDDHGHQAERTVVLSDGFWRRAFAADSSILGRSLTLNGEPHIVVGVMPRGFNAPVPWAAYDVWTTLPAGQLVQERDWRHLRVVGKLRADVDVGTAGSELEAISARLADRYPVSNHGISAGVMPLREAYLGSLRGPLLLLGLGAIAVLLIVCVNTAGMLLARSLARQEEVAMRVALGAGRGRLVRQFVAESLLVCGLGGAMGVLVGHWGLSALGSILASALPRAGEIRIDGGVLAFTSLVSLGVATVLGLAPLLNARPGPFRGGIRAGHAHGPSSARLRKTFVAFQFAVTLLLANAAALMLRSYRAVTDLEPGFDPEGVMTFTLTPEGVGYEDPRQRQVFFTDVLERVRSLPGVETAGAASKLPFEGGSNTKVMIEGRESEFVQARSPLIELTRVMPGYFETLRIPRISGRVIEARDFDTEAPGIVINATMARVLFADEDPLGQRVSWEIETPNWLTIVGVAGDVRQWGIEHAAAPEIYVPYTVLPRPRMFVAVRAAADPLTLIPSIRREVAAVDALVPIADVRTVDEIRAGSMMGRRFNAVLVGLLAGIALLLVTAGIYGVMAQHTARRTREIGIRMTLGADRRSTFRHILTTGMAPALLGMFLGLAAFLSLAGLLGRFVFGVSAADPVTLASSASLVLLLGLLGCFAPAWRAANTDFVRSIRTE